MKSTSTQSFVIVSCILVLMMAEVASRPSGKFSSSDNKVPKVQNTPGHPKPTKNVLVTGSAASRPPPHTHATKEGPETHPKKEGPERHRHSTAPPPQ